MTRIPSRWRARRPRAVLLRGEGAALVRFVWQNARRFTLAHDIGDGGAALACGGGRLERRRDRALAAPTGPGVLVTLRPRTPSRSTGPTSWSWATV